MNMEADSTKKMPLSSCLEVEIQTTDREIHLYPLCDHDYWEPKKKPKASKPKKKHEIRSLSVLYYCKVCRFSTMNKQTITTHSLIHNLKPRLSYAPCNINKTDIPDDHFKCPQCTYSTPIKHGLKQHMHIHLKERPIKCNDCDYYAKNIEELVTHYKDGHSTLEDLKCDVCDFTTKYKDRLKAHKRLYKCKQII